MSYETVKAESERWRTEVSNLGMVMLTASLGILAITIIGVLTASMIGDEVWVALLLTAFCAEVVMVIIHVMVYVCFYCKSSVLSTK